MVTTRAAAARSAARSAAARHARRSWNEMLPDILVLVLELLPCFADRQSFAATCVGWNKAAREDEAGELPAQLPMAVLSSSTPGAAAAVFSIVSGSMRRIHVPRGLMGAQLCGSHPGLWVAFTGHLPISGEKMIAVIKHMTATVIPLPVKMLVGNAPFQQGYSDMVDNIQAVSFSTDPSSPDCVSAAITGGQYPGIALRDAGAADHNMRYCWIRRSTAHVIIQDILFFDGPMGRKCFHAITDREDLVAASIGGLGPAVGINLFTYDVHTQVDDVLRDMPTSTRVVRYLVESRGKLLMVRRYYRCSPSNNGQRKTLFFRVFQWETTGGVEPSAWSELLGLDGRVIFLARGSSRSFDHLPRNSDIPAGSIYFLDDTTRFSDGSKSGSQQNNTDMGVYYMGVQGQKISMTPTLCSRIYGPRNYVVMIITSQGNRRIKFFERLEQLETYARKKSAGKGIKSKGSVWRFIQDPQSNINSLPPIWLIS